MPPLSFPYTPCVPDAERNVKVPSWLNDVSLYHNRGDTTFVGENSLYGDFFGLDDLFTENPRVVDGMIDIYKGWIKDFRIDGFRMDTMKHVNDEFWQKFSPAIVATRSRRGSTTSTCSARSRRTSASRSSRTSRPTTTCRASWTSRSRCPPSTSPATRRPTDGLKTFFENDDWYTDGDSNVYNLPTFLGNHDRGRIGMFLRNANPGAAESELLARDKLAHALMYLVARQPRRLLRRRAGLHGRGRRPGRAPGHVPVAEPAVQQPHRPRGRP